MKNIAIQTVTTLLCTSLALQASELTAGFSASQKHLGGVGRFAKWAKIEIPMVGKNSRGRGQPNPFAIQVDVVFTSPSDHPYRVPAFYDGDGKGGLDGNVWKVRFSADERGKWTFTSKSIESSLEGYSGSFIVMAPPKDAANFYRWGRLQYTGTAHNRIRYLK